MNDPTEERIPFHRQIVRGAVDAERACRTSPPSASGTTRLPIAVRIGFGGDR
jgi:hypothetical protein